MTFRFNDGRQLRSGKILYSLQFVAGVIRAGVNGAGVNKGPAEKGPIRYVKQQQE